MKNVLMKKILAVFILLIPFTVSFAFIVIDHGLVLALVAHAVALVVVALISWTTYISVKLWGAE